MKQTNIFKPTSTKSYLLLLFWLALILFAGNYIVKDALQYFGFTEEIYGRFWNQKWALIGHVTGGLLALLIGPFQFWKAFRMKYMTTHRNMGKVYLIAILVGALSSTILAWTTAVAIHWTWAVSLQALAFAWLVTAAMAYISIRRKSINQHKEWMVRSYVVTFGFVFFRFLNGSDFFREMGNFIERGPTIGWLAWTIPLLIAEVFLQWGKRD